VAGVVDTLGVDDQRVQQRAEVEQLIPVAVIAGQARDLEADHRADAAQTDLGHEPLKPGQIGGGRRRLPEILIDDDDLMPAQRAGVGRQVILPPATFLMMADLVERGLRT
jgi:hypothetical protein